MSYSIKKYYSTKQNNNYYYPPISTNDILSQLTYNLNTLKFQKIQKDYTTRRASVAAIIRVVPRNVNQVNDNWSYCNTLEKFLSQNWVSTGICEVLYIRRSLNPTDRWSGDLAFPGGKANPGENDRETCERETMEEVGLDLTSENFMFLGQLDHREIRSLASFKKLMILCPHVYLQISPATPPMHVNSDEIQSIHWVPLTFFMYDNFIDNWKRISYPSVKILYLLKWLKVLERSSQYYYLWKKIEEFILGKVYYGGILLPSDMKCNVKNVKSESVVGTSTPVIGSHRRNSNASFLPFSNKKKPLILWGITLGITSDLVDLLYKPEELPLMSIKELASARFSHKDLDLMVRCFKNGMPWKKSADYYQQIPCRKPVISEYIDDTEFYNHMKFSAYVGLFARVIILYILEYIINILPISYK
ncbi:hypothetical protein H8356DRAFT_941818 [Neocallimastix lanati (nom. inval.)]|uniref:Nudix hydrolase domain-containing protein n=1 Tax=Neocallimastix californiae TaxID=1754190 RepID=A0A1Y2ELD5_9FUNG|nr:hypothetical protein H8356DRAFT_941818 [Neocallimastix sp. JGI-2020a]ORY72359.1 hypothetical protein LY90DRAFT_503893 [Neocallimastix californiae]|eukprot:ORY72359.1 hypothetical protein LY90DRAFT_503893 [Neocallimastix californiae]